MAGSSLSRTQLGNTWWSEGEPTIVPEDAYGLI